jgi:hypothetical protein
VKELYVLRTRNLRKPVYWFFRSQTQINQKWAKVLLRNREVSFYYNNWNVPLIHQPKKNTNPAPRPPATKTWGVVDRKHPRKRRTKA